MSDGDDFGDKPWNQLDNDYKPSRLRRQIDHELNNIPTDWAGYTKEQKVDVLLGVINAQIRRVRDGSFDLTKGAQVAALALEGQLEMAEFYADIESQAKQAKIMSEFIENEVADHHSKLGKDSEGKKITEAALKRISIISGEARDAKFETTKKEKEFKKWKYVYEILQEAHVFFRTLGK